MIRYTPVTTQAQNILEFPPWKPEERHYELAEAQVELVPHTQPDGMITRRWCIKAQNSKGSSSEDIELFLLPGLTIPYERCLRCQQIRLDCPVIYTPSCKKFAGGGCTKCIQAGLGQQCADEPLRRSAQSAVMTEEVPMSRRDSDCFTGMNCS